MLYDDMADRRPLCVQAGMKAKNWRKKKKWKPPFAFNPRLDRIQIEPLT